jgi:hypothetical protein
MTRLEAILKDIESLEGKEVTIFGQPSKLRSDEERSFMPRVKTLLNDLMNYETNGVTSDDVMKFYDEGNDCLEVVQSFNSYNWGANIDHDIQYHHVKAFGDEFIILSVHRYGDARCNYTEEAVLKMTLDEFYDLAYESLSVYASTYIDGVTYNLDINGLNEGIRVTVLNDVNESMIDFDIFTSPDEEDIIRSIKDHLKEVAESEVK